MVQNAKTRYPQLAKVIDLALTPEKLERPLCSYLLQCAPIKGKAKDIITSNWF